MIRLPCQGTSEGFPNLSSEEDGEITKSQVITPGVPNSTGPAKRNKKI